LLFSGLGTLLVIIEPIITLSSLIIAGIGLIQWLKPSKRLQSEKKLEFNKTIREKLANFIEEGQSLRRRIGEEPLPVKDHNEWVDRLINYLKANLGKDYIIRLSDFTGFTFYGNSSEKSKYSNSIDGRIKRLHEFISEMS